MRKAMEKWLNQRQITFDPNTANSICDKFGLDGEKADECLGLCYQLEANKITQAEFTGGLCVLTGKEPEEVMGILRGEPPPRGTCYSDAWRYLMQHPEGMLIHGTALSLGNRIGHAWVELPDSTVWEPESQAILSKERFYSLVEPLEEARYTPEQAAIILARVGKHGPWAKEEVMELLKGMKGTHPKMTLDELDEKAVALFIKRHGREAYESGVIGETLERIEQRAEEYDPVFLSRHPELKGKSITVYHDPLAGEDWAVVNNETGEVVEIFSEEIMGVLKGTEIHKEPWQMTEVEWAKSPQGMQAELTPLQWRLYKDDAKWIHLAHENLIHDALVEGKPVPPEVLEDYPELVGKK